MKPKLLGRIAAAAALLLSAATATAHDFEVDGIYYNKNSDGTSASVTYKGSYFHSFAYEYSGTVAIPSEVTYEETTYSVTSISKDAFHGCKGLTSIVIPNSITSIGSQAFTGCSGLTSVEIPNSVTSIGDDAFSYCSGLTSVVIPNSVTSINHGVFSECSGLTSVVIPNSVTSIGSFAFSYCSGLTSVEISNSVTSIGDYAFSCCSGLTSFKVPGSISSLGYGVIYGCTNIESLIVDSKNTTYYSIDNCAIETATNTLALGIKNSIIPNNVTKIGDYAFIGCYGLTSVEMPSSVKEIGVYAFAECQGLTSLTIPGSVTSIDERAFSNCINLGEIVIPSSVTYIEDRVFYGCSSLQTIISQNPTPPTLPYEKYTFLQVPTTCVLYVPEESLSYYKGHLGWSYFTNIEAIPGTESDPNADTDLSQYENVIYVEGTKGFVGSTVTLSLKMNNVIEAVGFQCDFYVPEGTEVAVDGDGFAEINLSTERTNSNRTDYFNSAAQNDGAIRILANSTKSLPFSGNEGEIATIKLNIGSDVADGDYPLILKNIIISDADANSYKADYVKTTLTVSHYPLGDANGDGEVNISDFTAIANYILGKPKPNFVAAVADTNEDGEITVADLTKLVKLIFSSSATSNAPAKPAPAVVKSSCSDDVMY